MQQQAWLDERCNVTTAILLLAAPFFMLFIAIAVVYIVNGGIPSGNSIDIWRVVCDVLP